MKTAGRRTPNCRTHRSGNRAHGGEGQNRSCSIKWAAKVEKFRPREECFFLTFPFIEQSKQQRPKKGQRVCCSVSPTVGLNCQASPYGLTDGLVLPASETALN